MRVRAVVVNYNGGDEVLGCLRALLGSSGVELDVVLVDNGSSDGSVERVQAELSEVTVVRSPANLGYPAINQVVEDLAGIDAVAVVNPDAVVQPDCLSLLAAALDADPGRGAACPLILLPGAYRDVRFSLNGSSRASLDLLRVEDAGRWHLTGRRVRRRWSRGMAWSVGEGSVLRTTGEQVRLTVRAAGPGQLTLACGDASTTVGVGRRPQTVTIDVAGDACEVVQNAGSVIGRYGLGINRGYHRPYGPAFAVGCDVPAWCGAAVLLRSAYLQDVGLLDPRWFLYYEDTDLSWRGLLRGWRYRYVPAARVAHAHSTSIGHGSALYDVQHTRNRLLTVTKNAPARAVPGAWLHALRLVGSQLRSDVVGRLRDRRAPEPTLAVRRVTALASAASIAPAVIRERRSVRRRATAADTSLPVLGRWVDPVEEAPCSLSS
jgi:GT2 family glycosyltransferase